MLSSEVRTIHVALMTSEAGEVITWSGGCEALFGRNSESALGLPLWRLLEKNDGSPSAAGMSVLPAGSDSRDVYVLRPDGTTRAAKMILVAAIWRQ